MGAYDRLIDDTTLIGSSAASAGDSVSRYRDLRREPLGALVVGALVVPDQRLAEVGRLAGDQPLAVSVLNTGGAGGLVAIARRDVPGVEVVSVRSALRDLDDLAGNAARVVSAAAELGEDTAVLVEIPYTPGWVGAAEEVEAAGLLGAIRLDDGSHSDGSGGWGRSGAERLAEQLSVLVEADLPFAVTDGPDRAMPTDVAPGYITVMMALEALIDGAEPGEAAELLRIAEPDRIRAAVGSWDDATAARIRRRLRNVSSRTPSAAVDDLRRLGLPDPT